MVMTTPKHIVRKQNKRRVSQDRQLRRFPFPGHDFRFQALSHRRRDSLRIYQLTSGRMNKPMSLVNVKQYVIPYHPDEPRYSVETSRLKTRKT
ncbi:hypothetical protein HJC23_009359 [Cyclotella cryptica]|uniref:Uncharacterized protein n=1 Tax=Cyclotella cryptica TaxID=29204 RepID=A0ABD3QSL6_9STRA